MRKILGLVHNDSIATIFVVGFILLVHAIFALGGYYFGLFLAQLILYDQPGLQHSAAIVYAVLVFGGAMWRFVYMPYTKRHVQAYDRDSGEHVGWYLWFVGILIWILEIAHLGFRVANVPAKFQFVIAAAGLLLLAIAYCLGKILFAIINRPMEAYVGSARRWATRALGRDFANNASRFSIAQKERLAKGDMSVIKEVKDIRNDEMLKSEQKQTAKQTKKEQKRTEKEQRRQREDQDFATDQALTDEYLGRKETDPFSGAQVTYEKANHLSQSNGRN